MITEYIKIDNLFNYIPKSLREMQADDDQWLSWGLMALRGIKTQEMIVTDCDILAIDNHKVVLPKGLKKIKDIRILQGEPSSQALTSFGECLSTLPEDISELDGTDTKVVSYFDEACALHVQLFQRSLFYEQYLKPMKYVGTTTKQGMFTKSCYDMVRTSTYTGFSITTDKCLQVDCPSGYVWVQYETEPKDSDGNFLVPKDPQVLWLAMAQFAMAQHWLNRAGYKEQNAMNMYMEHLRLSRNYFREAKGIFNTKNISYRSLARINDTDMMRIPSVWSYKIPS